MTNSLQCELYDQCICSYPAAARARRALPADATPYTAAELAMIAAQISSAAPGCELRKIRHVQWIDEPIRGQNKWEKYLESRASPASGAPVRAARPPPAVRRPKAGARADRPSVEIMRGVSQATQAPVAAPNPALRTRNEEKEPTTASNAA